MNDMRQNTR